MFDLVGFEMDPAVRFMPSLQSIDVLVNKKSFRPSHIYGATRSIVVEGEEAGPVQDTRPSCLLTGPKQPCMVTLISCVSRVSEIVS